MSEVQGSEYVFGRPAVVDLDLPDLASDLCRSYQWPFHLRMHRNRWEFVGGKWRPVVERVHLRPGAGGVGGKPGDINGMNDLALMQQWGKVGDGQWLIIPSGDPRIHGTCNESGNFIRRVKVQNNGRPGHVLIAIWERVTDTGKIETDEQALTAFALQVIEKVARINAPTARAKHDATNKTRILLEQLQASAGSSRTPGGSPQLQKRIARVAALMADMTGEPVEGSEQSEQSEPKRGKGKRSAPPVTDPVEALRAALAALSPEQRAALLAPVAPEVTP
jgi:hypothetical protein